MLIDKGAKKRAISEPKKGNLVEMNPSYPMANKESPPGLARRGLFFQLAGIVA